MIYFRLKAFDIDLDFYRAAPQIIFGIGYAAAAVAALRCVGAWGTEILHPHRGAKMYFLQSASSNPLRIWIALCCKGERLSK